MDERPIILRDTFVKKNPWLISEQIMVNKVDCFFVKNKFNFFRQLSKELGCCVYSILEIMMKDEQEHKYSNFGSTYLKVKCLLIP